MARLGCECPEPGYCYTIEHGGYRKENIDIEYCEQVAAMGKDSDIIKFKQIPHSYVDGIWNQEDPEKWLTIIQVPVEKS